MLILQKYLPDWMHNKKYAWFWLSLTLLIIGIYTMLGPAEHSLGTHIRIAYLHGAWVWASLAAFALAGLFGSFGLLTQQVSFHHWSEAFGRTGLIFWISYLPLSLAAMQSNWNGLFLAEPRWRLALVFTIAGVLMQAGLSLANEPSMTSSFNLVFLFALVISIVRTPNVMHPASPVLNSDAWRIQSYFFGLVVLAIFAVWQLARWWYRRESKPAQP